MMNIPYNRFSTHRAVSYGAASAVTLVFVLVVLFSRAAQLPDSSPTGAGDVENAESATADQILQRAIAQAPHFPSLTARVRFSVRLLDTEVAGFGDYRQARIEERLRTRYELRLPVGGRTVTWSQINNAEQFWVRTDLRGKPELQVVDLRRLRQEIPDAERSLDLISGIGALLMGLRKHYAFTSVRPDKLGPEAVWVIEGRWKGGGEPNQESDGANFFVQNSQIAQTVILVLSRDRVLPYFPFRVEFWRSHATGKSRQERHALMTLEFYEVRAGDRADPRWYLFVPGDQSYTDETASWLDRWLKTMPQARSSSGRP
jgi:hypothetical protein